MFSVAKTASFSRIGKRKYKQMGIFNNEDEALFIAMSSSEEAEQMEMAICGFSMAQLRKAFTDTISSCHLDDGKSQLIRAFAGDGRRCKKIIIDQPVDKDFCSLNFNNFAEAVEPVVGTHLITIKDQVTALVVDLQGFGEEKEAVAVVGTESGVIKKLLIERPSDLPLFTVDLYQNDKDFSTLDKSIRPDLATDVGMSDAYLLSGSQLVKFPLDSCSLYTDPRSCHCTPDPNKCRWCGDFCQSLSDGCDQIASQINCSDWPGAAVSLIETITFDNTTEENFKCPTDSYNNRTCNESKMCIHFLWVCDGVFDCPDNSDEADCAENADCPSDYWHCDNFTRCIKDEWLCDNKFDCRDRSDEADCDERLSCPRFEIACDNKTSTCRLNCNRQIYEFWPKAGPRNGGTLITIIGNNLVEEQTTGVRVWIGTEPNRTECRLIGQPTDDLIVCQTEPIVDGQTYFGEIIVSNYLTAHKNLSDAIEITSLKLASSLFKYLKPAIIGVRPSFGPISGGTSVSIFGLNLDIGFKHEMFLAGVKCDVLYDQLSKQFFTCFSGSSYNRSDGHLTEDNSVRLFIDGHRINKHDTFDYIDNFENSIDIYWSDTFDYKPDPIITGIEPNWTVTSSKASMIVSGSYLNSVANPQMIVSVRSFGQRPIKFTVYCYAAIDGKSMICSIPKLLNGYNHRATAQLSFEMDGVIELRNLYLTNKQLSIFNYYPDPVFVETDRINYVREDDRLLVLDGRHLTTDYEMSILVGDSLPCVDSKIIEIDSKIECQIIFDPDLIKIDGRNHPGRVSVSNLQFDVGFVQFVAPIDRVLPIVFTVAGFLFLIALLVSSAYWIKKNFLKTKSTANSNSQSNFELSSEQVSSNEISNDDVLESENKQLNYISLNYMQETATSLPKVAADFTSQSNFELSSDQFSLNEISNAGILKSENKQINYISLNYMRETAFGMPKLAGDSTSQSSLELSTDQISLNEMLATSVLKTEYKPINYMPLTNILETATDVKKTNEEIDDNKIQQMREEKLLICKECLTLKNELGRGFFGIVFKGTLEIPGESIGLEVAVKTIQGNRRNESDVYEFIEEALIMKDFEHDNVLKLIGVSIAGNGQPMVIVPLMANGDLRLYVKDNADLLTIEQLIAFAIQVAQGMSYLAKLKFVHRDLAARNCLLSSDLTVKVADFGLAKDVYRYQRACYRSRNRKMMPIAWMSLESMEHHIYNTKTDVWSFGVLLWELMSSGAWPYPGVPEECIFSFLKSGRRMACPNRCPEEIYNVILKCWMADPNRRPAFKEIVERISDIRNNLK